MRVNILPCRYPLNPCEWPTLLAQGVRLCGDQANFGGDMSVHEIQAFWGMRRVHGQKAMREGRTCMVVERAYLGDRFKWHSIGFNGLNGHAQFPTDGVPSDRWDKYWRAGMQPWKHNRDGYALIIGQVPGDAALKGTDIYKWAASILPEVQDKYGKVRFRHHPLAKRRQPMPGVEIDALPLAESLAGAQCVITYNSNTAVDAVYAGVPTVAYDKGSMAWEVTSRSVSDPLVPLDREDWGRKIAYSQWLPEELQNGTAWRHIRQWLTSR